MRAVTAVVATPVLSCKDGNLTVKKIPPAYGRGLTRRNELFLIIWIYETPETETSET